jgi:hypothetical protein
MIIGNGEGCTVMNFIVFTVHKKVRVIKCRSLMWARHRDRMEESRSAFETLTSKPIGKIPLGSPRHRWEENVRMDSQIHLGRYQCKELH